MTPDEAADYVLSRARPYQEIYDFFLSRRDDRAFLTALLKSIGRRRVDESNVGALEHFLYDIFMWGFAQGSISGTRRAEWLFAAIRDWPPGVARDRALRWCGTALEHEILEPTAADGEELTRDLASSDAARVARALVIVAGVADLPPRIVLAPFGIDVLERAGAKSLENGLAFLRCVTQFRGFAPPLRRATRIELAIATLVRATEDMIGIYVADWLLDQGHAEEAVDEALVLLVERAPEQADWAVVGETFLWRLWKKAPPRLREPTRDAIRRRLGEVPRGRRDAVAPLRAWLRGVDIERAGP